LNAAADNVQSKQRNAAGKIKGAGGQQAPQEEKYYAEFLPDVDNFVGVRDIENYVITAIRDDGYCLGEKSVGILHLFNKLDKSKVQREDLARIHQFSRLVGALCAKAQSITSCLTLVIGLTQNIRTSGALISGINTMAGMGEFEHLGLPVDALVKQSDQEIKAHPFRDDIVQRMKDL